MPFRNGHSPGWHIPRRVRNMSADLLDWPLMRHRGEPPARDPVKGFAARIEDSIECDLDSARE